MKDQKLPDVQDSRDLRGIDITWVGIKDYRVPICIKTKEENEQSTIAKIEIYSSLSAENKGAHMSRFSQIIEKAIEKKLYIAEAIQDMLKITKEKLESENTRITLWFPYFIVKNAPISGVKSHYVVDCSFCGILRDGEIKLFLEVNTLYNSLCPCSRKMSLTDEERVIGMGAHNQRGNARVRVGFRNLKDFIWIEDIIEMTEKSASCEIYNSLKRPDEKYVTEKSYLNPQFCEDVARDIAVQLNEKKDVIDWYEIEITHQESIHQADAVSYIKKNL